MKAFSRPLRARADLDKSDESQGRQFYGIHGRGPALDAFFNVLNSDGAASDLNYWRGQNETAPDQNPLQLAADAWGEREERGVSTNERTSLDGRTQILFTLFVLRTGVTLSHAAFDFGITSATASRYFTTWISFLYERLPKIFFPLAADQSARQLPRSSLKVIQVKTSTISLTALRASFRF
jgi:hypothetical protein